ncbi:MAG: hypothetical protein ACMG6E_05165 [Candidatus Roizmanbacteria bacterium]
MAQAIVDEGLCYVPAIECGCFLNVLRVFAVQTNVAMIDASPVSVRHQIPPRYTDLFARPSYFKIASLVDHDDWEMIFAEVLLGDGFVDDLLFDFSLHIFHRDCEFMLCFNHDVCHMFCEQSVIIIALIVHYD